MGPVPKELMKLPIDEILNKPAFTFIHPDALRTPPPPAEPKRRGRPKKVASGNNPSQ